MPTIRKTKVEFEGRIEEREVIVEEEHVLPWDADADLRLVGRPTPRVDGVARVTGQAVYTHDLHLPGMLVGRFLRSPHPHARLKRIDSRRAEAMEGVWCVWHRDQPPPITHLEGREVFAAELAYEGAEVAFVVASDERVLEDALGAIEVEYEPLPFVSDLEGAMAPDGPVAVEGVDGNLITPEGQITQRGEVDAGLAAADVVVELTFTTPVAAHCCLETHGSAAVWEGDQLTLYHSTQSIFGTRSSIADALDIPQDKVRVICNYMGGGFGSKWGAEPFSLMAALAARETRRPVKAMLDRREEHLVAGYRPRSRQRVRLGAKRDGTLTLIEHEAWVVTGATGDGGSIIGGPAKDLYACDNVKTVVWAYRANTDNSRAFRAPGYVEGTFGLESAMEALAQKLRLDPLELRLRNYAELSPSRGVAYTTKKLREAYEMGAERMAWHDRELHRAGDGPWRRGWGMASQLWGGGGGPPANATVKLLPDGTAEVMAGVQDIGTGTRTALAQIAAEELGVEVGTVRVVVGDTLPTPYGPTSSGSQTLPSAGPAVRAAARDCKRQLLDLAAQMLDRPGIGADQLEVRDGAIVHRADPALRLPFADVARKLGGYTLVGDGARGPNPEGLKTNTFGAQFAEVEVNVETGEVRVRRVVAVHDVGRIINPLTATSQAYGGIVQGTSYATLEERVLDGQLGLDLNPNLEHYYLPTIMDVPHMEAGFVDLPDPRLNNIGAKGLGEPPIIPTAPAIANAVCDATGVRLTDFPLTRRRVLDGLRAAEGSEEEGERR